MRSIRVLIFAIASFIALALVQVPASAQTGWTSVGQITNIFSHDGLILVITNIQSGPACADAQAGWFFWPSSTQQFPDHKEMYALALSAMLSGRSVAFLTDANSCWPGTATRATHAMIASQ